MSDGSPNPQSEIPANVTRRSFFSSVSTVAMAGGLAAGYGTFGALGARYLYQSDAGKKAWLFVAAVDSLAKGESFTYRTPDGAGVTVARQGEGESAEDFVALSSICPHLGCKVHWEPQNDRFFCPCHNGSFDASGDPTGGPPKDANQALTRFPLKVDQGLLYIEVTQSASVADASDDGPRASRES